MPLCGALSHPHRDREPIRRRCERAHPLPVVCAGRVVRKIEIEHEPSVLYAEIGALDGVE